MRLKTFTGIVVVLISSFAVFGQDSLLRVGDSCPDIRVEQAINLPENGLSLAGLRGKLVILDFWSVHCAACIRDFRRLERLQQIFNDDLQIILVTTDKREEVSKLIQRSDYARTFLPMVVEDSAFSRFFPLKIPHHVWVDSQGVIRAITSTEETTERNIARLLAGYDVHFSGLEMLNDFNHAKPLFAEQRVNFLTSVQQYSFLTGYYPVQLNRSTAADPVTGKTIRRSFYNQSIAELYKIAYGGFSVSNNKFGSDWKRVILQVEDPSVLLNVDTILTNRWLKENTYCYEIQVDTELSDSVQVFMQKDLKRYFNLIVSVERRMVPCLILETTTGGKLKTSQRAAKYSGYNADRKLYQFHGQAPKRIASLLSSKMDYIVLDRTGSDEKIDLSFPDYVLNDLKVLNMHLEKSNLQIRRENSPVDFLVIKEQQ